MLNFSLDDAFKVNIYLKYFNLWPLFDEVYIKHILMKLFIVNTSVQSVILYTFLAEV